MPEDLRNTDNCVVRIADGKLIAERISLNEYEADCTCTFSEGAANGQFFYTLQMRNSITDASAGSRMTSAPARILTCGSRK